MNQPKKPIVPATVLLKQVPTGLPPTSLCEPTHKRTMSREPVWSFSFCRTPSVPLSPLLLCLFVALIELFPVVRGTSHCFPYTPPLFINSADECNRSPDLGRFIHCNLEISLVTVPTQQQGPPPWSTSSDPSPKSGSWGTLCPLQQYSRSVHTLSFLRYCGCVHSVPAFRFWGWDTALQILSAFGLLVSGHGIRHCLWPTFHCAKHSASEFRAHSTTCWYSTCTYAVVTLRFCFTVTVTVNFRLLRLKVTVDAQPSNFAFGNAPANANAAQWVQFQVSAPSQQPNYRGGPGVQASYSVPNPGRHASADGAVARGCSPRLAPQLAQMAPLTQPNSGGPPASQPPGQRPPALPNPRGGTSTGERLLCIPFRFPPVLSHPNRGARDEYSEAPTVRQPILRPGCSAPSERLGGVPTPDSRTRHCCL